MRLAQRADEGQDTAGQDQQLFAGAPGDGAVRGREMGQDIVDQGVLRCSHGAHARRYWKNPWMVFTMGVARITPTRPTVACHQMVRAFCTRNGLEPAVM